MKPWEIIKQLESVSGRKDKENILLTELIRAPKSNFWEGCRVALDPTLTFGIKQVPENKNGKVDVDDFDSSFNLAATGFINRSLTGNSARDAINGLMHHCSDDAWNYWYRRILIKDLRCGVTETTINKIRPDTVPVFSCQLAKDATDHKSKLRGKKILDYKLDGVRVIAVIQRIDSGMINFGLRPKVTLFSRNGKVFENFGHIEDQLSRAATEMEGDWVLDGEITSASFQSLMTQVHRKKDANASDAVYNVFDFLPFDHFFKGKWDRPQVRRSKELKDFMGNFIDCENIQRLDYIEVDLDTGAGLAHLDHMRDIAAIRGLEGVMVKDADAPYECKRTDAWLKIKPNITVDLTVVNIEEGTGRNEGRLGALVCEGVDNGRSICVNVGSGFSDGDRDVFWSNRSSVVGQTVEVKADAVTQNQDGTYSLRFPRFVRFRGFEPGEKL
jgi:DNA ligase-1